MAWTMQIDIDSIVDAYNDHLDATWTHTGTNAQLLACDRYEKHYNITTC
jgi:hypothetical protein